MTHELEVERTDRRNRARIAAVVQRDRIAAEKALKQAEAEAEADRMIAEMKAARLDAERFHARVFHGEANDARWRRVLGS